MIKPQGTDDNKAGQNETAKSPSTNSEFLYRVVFGLLLAAAAFFLTWVGGYAFQIFVAIVAVIMFGEYRKICGVSIPMRVAFLAFAFLLLNMAAWISKAYDTAIILGLFAFLALWAWEVLIRRSGWGAVGLIYVLIPFFALVHIRGESDEGLHVILLLYACVWGADTMAYFVGKAVGGPKLIPRISPGKTWSGFFGGLVGGVLIGWAVISIAGYSPKPVFFVISLVLVIFSQFGDLVESALKRRFNVKDSGTLIPGHGGVLDRIDGLVFTAGIAWILALSHSGVFFGTWTWEPAIGFISAIATN